MVMRIGAAKPHASHEEGANGALPSPVSASVAHLKVKGTAIVASLAPRRRIIETMTRSFRSRRSAGQMYGHNPRMMANREPPSPDTSRFKAAVDRGWKSVIGRSRSDGPRGQTVEPFSYRDFRRPQRPRETHAARRCGRERLDGFPCQGQMSRL